MANFDLTLNFVIIVIIINIITWPPIGVRSILINVSVCLYVCSLCLCVCVSVRLHMAITTSLGLTKFSVHVNSGRGSLPVL